MKLSKIFIIFFSLTGTLIMVSRVSIFFKVTKMFNLIDDIELVINESKLTLNLNDICILTIET